jgi:hypothetical protein
MVPDECGILNWSAVTTNFSLQKPMAEKLTFHLTRDW